MADQYTKRAMQALLGLTVTYTLYPVVGVGVEEGVTATSGTGVWGADAEIIAASAITTEYWVCAANVDAQGTNIQALVVDIEIAGTTSVFSFRFQPTALTTVHQWYLLPFPRYIPANSQLTCRISGATNTTTLNVSALVATGL